MSKYETLLVSKEGNILFVSINRPNALNALNRQTLSELETVMQEIYQNDKILGVILSGTGEKAFVAGADIKEFEGLKEEEAAKLSQFGQNLFDKLDNSSKPIMAAINGFALGGGCELAMACHLRIATKNAKLGLPETSLGIVPGYGGTRRLTQLVGKAKSLELILSAEMINATQALEIGLVNYVVESHEELISFCTNLMNKILSRGPVALAKAIECVNAPISEQDPYKIERNAFAHCATTEDFKEGVDAFLQKRKPKFNGK